MSNTEFTADQRLAVYGTLAPGRPNEHIMADIAGRWRPGTVRGTLNERGWGAAQGFPGITLDGAHEVDCVLFESPELPEHWAMLDEFEGDGYRRVVTRVAVEDGEVEAYIYELSAH